nr:hypothetical protein [Variovorax boronicumulans]
MSKFEYIGDFLYDEVKQAAEFAAFGLILFDRLNESWPELSKQDLFFWHEELFECVEWSGKKIARQAESRIMASKRHEKSRAAKEFVRKEWQLHREAYQSNKSAFSRDYARRVNNEFSFPITEKQMRDVWLSDESTPPACE